jgi:hypothetical protein
MSPPQIFPPPSGAHSACNICDMNYYKVETQQRAIPHFFSGCGEEFDNAYYGAYVGSYTDSEAQAAILVMIGETTEDLEYVKRVLKTHGDLILSRWTKKSKDKRGKVLGSVATDCFGTWPRLSESGISELLDKVDFTRNLDPAMAAIAAAPDFRDNIIGKFSGNTFGAYIDITEFTEDRMKLLSFLHVRSAYAPGDWAMFDAVETKRYFHGPRQPLYFNDKCVTMSGEGFGRLVDFDVGLIHSGAALGFPRACTTLLVQGIIADGLRCVVDEIVAGAAPSGDLKWTKLVSDGLHSSATGARWSAYENQLFAPPMRFDPKFLLEMARDQLNRVVDEFELLQTPQYMRDYALELKAQISWDASVSSTAKWGYIAASIVAPWIKRLSEWQAIVVRSQDLVDLYEKNGTACHDQLVLPKDVETATAEYGTAIRDMIETQFIQLCAATYNMEALKHDTTVFEVKGTLRHRLKPVSRDSKQRDLIIHRISTLQASMSHRSLDSGRSAMFELVQQLSKVQPDRYVNDMLPTCALLDTMRLAWLSGHVVPLDSLRNTSAGDRDEEQRMDALLAQTGLTSLKSNQETTRQLGTLLRDFCKCPWPKNRHSSNWLERTTEARKLLAKFWGSVRDEWQQDPTSNVTDAVKSYMSFDSSPRYLAEVEEERTTLLAEAQRSRAATTSKQEDTHAVQTVWGHEPEQPKFVRTKAKSTLVAEDDKLDLAGLNIHEKSHTAAVSAPAKVTIAVKQNSKRVFDKISSRTATASNFRWNHLVDALIDAGMIATQAPGCAVRFENDHGSIVFHQPHGYNHNSTLDAEFLRSQIGKRLTKWFGWDRDTFVERKKDGQ